MRQSLLVCERSKGKKIVKHWFNILFLINELSERSIVLFTDEELLKHDVLLETKLPASW